MKKSLLLSVVAAAVMAAGSVSAADFGKCGDTTGRISVSGQGEVKVQPDRVSIDYNVSARKNTADEARKEVEKVIGSFFDSVKDVKFADEKGPTAGTISVYPRYETKDGKQTLTSYEARRNVQVILDDFSLISDVNDKAMAAGINEISGMRYLVSDAEKYRNEAAKKAMESVKAQAEMLAGGFGVKVDRPCQISYNSNYGPVPVYRNTAVMKASADSAGGIESVPAVYSPEPVEINAHVSADFAIKE